MEYETLSKNELLKKIYSLEAINKQLLKEKEQEAKLNYDWAGNLGHWYWYIEDNNVTFNPLKITNLGYSEKEIPKDVDYEFFTNKLHPEDYNKTMKAMRDHITGKENVYEIEYRIKCKDGGYKWYYDIGKITQYDKEGRPLLLAGIVFDITERKSLEIELKKKNKILFEKAFKDELTKMFNFRSIKECLYIQVNESKYKEVPLSIIIFDIDNFKKINDTKGHVFGNKVIIKISEIIRENIRKDDIAGRFGGEEFIVILPNTDLNTATNVAERIRKAIDKNDFQGVKVTISGGVNQYNNEDVFSLIEIADQKLYTAKKTGKNKIIS